MYIFSFYQFSQRETRISHTSEAKEKSRYTCRYTLDRASRVFTRNCVWNKPLCPVKSLKEELATMRDRRQGRSRSGVRKSDEKIREKKKEKKWNKIEWNPNEPEHSHEKYGERAPLFFNHLYFQIAPKKKKAISSLSWVHFFFFFSANCIDDFFSPLCV